MTPILFSVGVFWCCLSVCLSLDLSEVCLCVQIYFVACRSVLVLSVCLSVSLSEVFPCDQMYKTSILFPVGVFWCCLSVCRSV